MQKITLLCVGAIKTRWISAGCTDYLERLQHSFDMEIMELPASKEKDPLKQGAEESARLLASLEKKEGDVWVLDETGVRKTSTEFAKMVSMARDGGRPLLFLLGGAYGLTDEVRKRAQHVLRLSDMTFPHELCRLIFLEQLYRASEIGRGSGYHH